METTVKADELLKQLKAELATDLGTQVETRTKALEDKITKQEELIARLQAASEARAAASLPGSGEATHKGEGFSFLKLFNAVATNDWRAAGLEREIVTQATEAWRSKAMATAPDSAGGYIVPIEVSSGIIEKLYASSVVTQRGATRISGLSGYPFQMPKQSGSVTAYWVGETTTITASDMTLAKVDMTPKFLAALTVYSKFLGQVSNPSVEAMLRNDMAQMLGLKLDLGALKGTGSSYEPLGLANSGISTSTLTDPGTYDEFVDFVQTVRGSNALLGSLGWVVSNADFSEIWKMKDASNQPMLLRNLAAGATETMMGYPISISTQLSDGDVYFGNWSDLVIADWGPFQIETTNALGFLTMQNHIRATWPVDVAVRRTESFCKPA